MLHCNIRKCLIIIANVSISLITVSCNQETPLQNKDVYQKQPQVDSQDQKSINSFCYNYKQLLKQSGYVDIHDIDSSIMIALRYATTNNFLNRDMYNGFKECYMQPETAEKLKKAQTIIHQQNSDLTIVVFDATRPWSVQKLMWDSVQLSTEEKCRFLAHPSKHSMHSFGAAIDCGLANTQGVLLDMGTEFDFAGEKAFPCLEKKLQQKGILSQKQIDNRQLLRNAMTRAGFTINSYEWWHFNACTKQYACQHYILIKDFGNSKIVNNSDCRIESRNDSIVYCVQLVTLSHRVLNTSSVFKSLSVWFYKQDNNFKYVTGHCKTYEEAFELRKKVIDCGFDQAFIVCLKNGQRISLKDLN